MVPNGFGAGTWANLTPASLVCNGNTSLAGIGNLSSASVLHVQADTLRERPPPPGSHGVLMALGPGFCSELVLLRATGAGDAP